MAKSTLLPPAELREGKSDQMVKPHSRKRSAKNAHNTKAPMDGEECDCGNKKKGRYDGGKCDCSGYSKKDMMAPPKRTDSLSAPKYLKAWDMGIQDRTTPYIRARLDETERLDLKCGKGAISEGEKCTKGPAMRVQQAKRMTAYSNYGKPLTNRQIRKIESNLITQARTTGKPVKPSREQTALLAQTRGTQTRKLAKQSLIGKESSDLKKALKTANPDDPLDKALTPLYRRELFNRRARVAGYALGGALAVSTAQNVAGALLMKRVARNYKRDSVYASGFNVDASRLTP